ncbi:hypothetical protein OESDEN_24722 [Oesophagostomum dentatum]|uniref:Uncharacterized protein n=1 Tax=Oesophagostomum dentatum TaxID=61180 RepID=A0A0B1RWW1_OESDE|nr:hypothetical protein OESDEN_24722 [Oesophagostomum dentatum]
MAKSQDQKQKKTKETEVECVSTQASIGKRNAGSYTNR